MIFGIHPLHSIPVGAILAHSLKYEGLIFKKGRTLTQEDLDEIKKRHIKELTVAITEVGDVHEDPAAKSIADQIVGINLETTAPFTGRVNLISNRSGILELDIEKLLSLNQINEAITIATLPAFSVVQPKQLVATIKIIPFAVHESLVNAAIKQIEHSLVSVAAFDSKSVSLIQTELPTIKDSTLNKTAKTLEQRLEHLNSKIIEEKRCYHCVDELEQEIKNSDDDADIIILTGASAITDRRDILPMALENAGGSVLHLGMPVDPGNLLMLGQYNGKKVIGMPGCARSPKLNGFDWVLQRICADMELNSTDFAHMAVGGLLKEIPSRPSPRIEKNQPMSTGQSPKIGIILLAAGQSRRMGAQNKLFAEYNGIPLLKHALDCLVPINAEDFIVISGHEANRVSDFMDKDDVRTIHNPDFKNGLSTSLKLAISELSDNCDAALICLSDMPLLTTHDVKSIIASYSQEDGREICIPTFEGKRGNPVLIGRKFFSEILDLSGDIGAKPIISSYPEHVCEVAMTTDAILTDTDTPEALTRLNSISDSE